MFPQVEPADERIFTDAACRSVREHFARSLVAMDVMSSHADALAQEIADRFAREGHGAFAAVRTLLDQRGVRARWNRFLDRKRASQLGAWVAPHVAGTLLDLQCGDGAVGKAIGANIDRPVTLAEYAGFRGPALRDWLGEIIDPEELFSEGAPGAAFDSVFLCTVLHHSVSPRVLLAQAERLARHRIIIVENCVDADFPASYQQLVDLFFNECLNETPLGSPGAHRSAQGWIALTPPAFRAALVSRRTDIAGIPLAHTLIVLDRVR